MRYEQPIPFYMAYPFLLPLDQEQAQEKDLQVMKSFYSRRAARIQEKADRECDRMEYEGSMMYDEYPDQLSLRKKSLEIWERAEKGERFGKDAPGWEQVQDLIGVLLLQEMMCRRKTNRRRYTPVKVIDTLSKR